MSQHDQPNRILAWDACYNARDIGGYPVGAEQQTRWRAITRADNLHRLTPGGQAALRDYGVRTVIDLRLADELQRHPNPFADQQTSSDMPRYLNLPLHDPEANAAMDLAELTEGEYIVILERSKPLIAAVIQAVADGLEEGGVVVHCHGGKDRTGIVVALLLTIAGVPRETIIEDYTLSEAQLEPVHTAWLERTEPYPGPTCRHPALDALAARDHAWRA